MTVLKIIGKVLPVGWFVAGWFLRVTADKRITLPELLELLSGLAAVLELEVTIEVPQSVIDQVGASQVSSNVRLTPERVA